MRSMVSSWSSVKPLSCEAGEGGAQCAPGEGPALREERPHPPLRGTPASAGAGSSPASGRRGRSVVDHRADRLAVMHQVERLVDPLQRQGVGDVRIEVEFTRHLLLHHARQLRAALDAAATGAEPLSAGAELDRTSGNLTPPARAPDPP